MNKEFVKKIIKAEMLRYQAIKEILPDSVKNRMEIFEKDVGNLVKDVALEIVSENLSGRNKTEQAGEKEAVRRVQVDFK